MFRYLIIFFFVLLAISCKAQISEEYSLKFAETYSDLNSGKKTAEFDIESKQFSFENYSKKSNDVNYKLLINDIHPLGVFLVNESEQEYVVRILSIDNGKRFVKEQIVNGLRMSNNTNYVDLYFKGYQDETEVLKFINELTFFIEEKVRKKKGPQEIRTVKLPNNKG